MLDECDKGNIDIILTKSIQRFTRNTVDLLEIVRDLKSKGIEVRFEKENINSMSGDGELMLSILVSFAQEESRQISENVKWGIRKRIERGMLHAGGHFRIYGYRWEGDILVPHPEEAKIVKRIFNSVLEGEGLTKVAKELNEEYMPTSFKAKWHDSTLYKMIRNKTYTGNMLFQKEYKTSPINGKRKLNSGEKPQYLLQNSHEAIISQEFFDKVQ